MSKLHLYLLAAALTVIGLSLAAYKHFVLGFPLRGTDGAELWTVEAHLSFERHTSGSVKARLTLPKAPPGFRILSEDFVSRGYGLTTEDAGDNRQAMWAVRRVNGKQGLYYRVTVFRDTSAGAFPPQPAFPDPPAFESPYAEAIESLLDEVRAQSADVATFVSALLKKLDDPGPDTNARLVRKLASGDFGRAELATLLLAGARIPARVLQVVPITTSAKRVDARPWLAAHNGNRWVFFDPATGASGLGNDLLIWAWGERPLYSVSGGINESLELAVQPQLEDAIAVAEQRAEAHGSRAAEYALSNLPIPTQAVYSVLLMIPIGALVIVLMRNVIGVRTFGTFMPVLVAVAFRETRLVSGLVLFALLVSAGLAARFYLERLRLLLVPRLAAILTIVVLLMLGVSMLAHRLGLEIGLSIALFPMVIMTMVIERMSIVWDERGPAEAIRDGIGTLAVASIAYLVMGIDQIEHLIFVFPELLLPLLAFLLLMGRYTGYRLTEFKRFRALTGGEG
jgi:hypothetical protein